MRILGPQVRLQVFVSFLMLHSVAFATHFQPELEKMDLESPKGIPSELKEAGITEHLGSSVSIEELSFKDERGKTVHLSDYFNKGRPVLLNLVYYECPNLCGFLLNGLMTSLKKMSWTAGEKFEIVTVSIHPGETPDLARGKKEAYLQAYGRPQAQSGWHFLTGEETQLKKLASQVGFGYRYDLQEKQYAHSAAIFILTPAGKISRYLYGIEFSERDLKLALLEASSGKIGTVVDRFLLFCYRYNPQTRKYSVYLTQLMQAGCGGTVVIFGGYLAIFWRRQRKVPEGLENPLGFDGSEKKEPNSNV